MGDVCCLFAPSSLFVTISVSLLVSSSHCVSLALTLCFSHTVCLPLTLTMCLFLSSLAFGSFYQQTPRPPLQTHRTQRGKASARESCWFDGFVGKGEGTSLLSHFEKQRATSALLMLATGSGIVRSLNTAECRFIICHWQVILFTEIQRTFSGAPHRNES